MIRVVETCMKSKWRIIKNVLTNKKETTENRMERHCGKEY